MNKGVLRKTNVDAVKQSIRNILLTDKGERPFQPNFGGNIRALLFDNATPQTFDFAKQNIRAAIESYEPRADVMDVVISGEIDRNEIFITIVFQSNKYRKPCNIRSCLRKSKINGKHTYCTA